MGVRVRPSMRPTLVDARSKPSSAELIEDLTWALRKGSEQSLANSFGDIVVKRRWQYNLPRSLKGVYLQTRNVHQARYYIVFKFDTSQIT